MRLLPDKQTMEGLRSEEQVRFILQRERSRSDRTGDALAVVTFTPRVPHKAQGCWETLAEICRERLRVTDEIGWLDPQRVCVILPGTDAAGGWKVADDIRERFPDEAEAPECSVYAIPGDDGPSSRDGDMGGRGQPSTNGNGVHAPSRPAPSLDALLLLEVPVWKRALDVFGSSVGLILLVPILCVIALIMKVLMPGPIFFKQLRSGRGGKPFLMYKFRTMVVDAEAKKATLNHLNERDGPVFKIKKDPRVTWLGRILRATSIDELPQLWNVFKGEMSLVGPRPLPCAETDASARWQRRRLDVNPGLTCIWQIKGRRGVGFAEWIRMDMEYIRTMSLVQDLKLLLLTIPAVLLRQGAH